MAEIIDTTQMYIKAIYEMLEEGIPAMRARIVERLGQSVPTVSETVGRMERDGLLKVAKNREIVLTVTGKRLATTIMRRHRLAELLLHKVLKIEWEYVHNDACGWEHVMSQQVEDKISDMFGEDAYDPYGNPIPLRISHGKTPKIAVLRVCGEKSLQDHIDNLKSQEKTKLEQKAELVSLDSSIVKVADNSILRLRLVRIGEPVQVNVDILKLLKTLGIGINSEVEVHVGADHKYVLCSPSCKEGLAVTSYLAKHIYFVTI